MKRLIKVSASFGGKITTGNYQNMNPSFFAEESFEFDGTDAEVNAEFIRRQKELIEICVQNFDAEALRAKIIKIKQDCKDFRWYKASDGREFPSVTSIIGYDTDFLVPEHELKQYAAQGTIIHAQVAEFIRSGEWKEPKDIKGIGPELFLLKTGNLGLPLDGWDFKAFLEKNPLTEMENGVPRCNLKYEYGGTPDIPFCLYKGIPTLADIKRTPDKQKNFMQMAAYAKCDGMKKVEQLMIIPLNDKTAQGFSKPIITTEIERYFELFLYKRENFRKVYGI